MPYKLTFVGSQPNETTPDIAMYAIDASGRVGKKLATASNGALDVAANLTGVVAFGPNVTDTSTLDPKSLYTVRLTDQAAAWKAQNAIALPAQWWRTWIGFQICLAGKASRCFPFLLEDRMALLKANALGRISGINIPFPICSPLCNGVVEVWESTCCCWPIPILKVPSIIANLKAFLAENPVMFPTVPLPGHGPDPGPVDRVLANKVNLALSAGKVATTFAPNTELSQHLDHLQTMQAQDALKYIEVNPSLWPFFCTCSSAKLGETALNPDGSFSFCFHQFPFLLLLNCRRSYFYKVKQFINGQWTYVYDGAAAHQYFNADAFANLSTFIGLTCHQPPPPPGTDIVALQAIGATNTWDLNSHWNGADAAHKDLTQNGDVSLSGPPADAGLLNPNGAPWGATLSFLLYFDPGMKALGAQYYRLSVVQSDSTGKPLGGATPQPITNSVAWDYFETVGPTTFIVPQTLGPQPVLNGNHGLYTIPYNADHEWLGGQFHQYLDTTLLPNNVSTAGPGNGQYLLVLEVFDSTGHRIVPTSAGAPAPGEVAKPFNFIRLLTNGNPGTTSNVPFKSLTHMLWVDNRQVAAEIDNFAVNGAASSQECQFLKAPGTALFQVGYRAYHRVLGDTAPAPHPTRTFMSSFELDWEEGLNGPSGLLDSGGDIDKPLSRDGGSPAVSPGKTFNDLLGAQTACAFGISLHVYCKHTNGTSHLNQYDREVIASVALSKT